MSINPLKIGKYTFWVSFILGSMFMLGFLIFIPFGTFGFCSIFGILGLIYLKLIAIPVNFAIFSFLLFLGIFKIDKVERKQCFVAIAIMLINIPVVILYISVGLFLGEYFNNF